VGSGNVIEEKLIFLLKSGSKAKIEMAPPMYREVTIALTNKFNIEMHNDVYDLKYLEEKHMVVGTTDNQKEVKDEN
jgi:precorrin-2 dehydrogenase/sirohydrochlorin ferrochelatase